MYEDLYEKNKGLIRSIAQKYRGFCEQDRAVSMEDLMQAGFIGLVRAAQTFDGGTGKSWMLQVRWCVIDEIRNTLGLTDQGMTRPHSNAVSLDTPISDDDGDATFGEMLADEALPEADEALLLEELQTSVRAALAQLNDPRQRQVAELYMLDGQNIKQVAESTGMTPARVLQLYGRALAQLAKDTRLRALADLDDQTRFHAHKGVRAFNSSQSSVVEDAVLWRIQEREKRGL